MEDIADESSELKYAPTYIAAGIYGCPSYKQQIDSNFTGTFTSHHKGRFSALTKQSLVN